MTMPSSIKVFWHNGNLNSVALSEPHEETGGARYIRADIADELARTLEMAKIWLDVDGRFDMQGINAALAKYNAARNNTTPNTD